MDLKTILQCEGQICTLSNCLCGREMVEIKMFENWSRIGRKRSRYEESEKGKEITWKDEGGIYD